jgi:hypothetical protein
MGGDVVYGGCVVLVRVDRGGIDRGRCCVMVAVLHRLLLTWRY